MTSLVQSLGPLVLGALVVWYVVGPLLGLAAISCFVCAAGLLAIGDTAAAGVAGYGVICWLGSHLLYRLRYGAWRTARAAHLLGRFRPGAGRCGQLAR
jgi:predicted membrane protein